MYRNALVTTDGSLLAEAVLAQVPHVLDPAGRAIVVEVVDSHAQVVMRLSNVGLDLTAGRAPTPELVERTLADERATAERHLQSARAALAAAGVANVETVVLEGHPGSRIVEEAVARGVDVVLMATHGRSGFRRTILGSVADHVLRHLDGVPVLLVHPTE